MFMCTQAITQAEKGANILYTYTPARSSCTHRDTNTQRLTQNTKHKGQHVGDEPFMF